MKPVPGTLQGGGASFGPPIERDLNCSRADEHESEALAQLCRDYSPPLYSFNSSARLLSEHAQDLVQGFFMAFRRTRPTRRQTVEREDFALFCRLDQALHRDARDRERALKRGGDRIEFVLLEEEMEAVESLYASDQHRRC